MAADAFAPELEVHLERLRRCARHELPGALAELRLRFPAEEFYALALQTTPRHDSLALVGASEEALEFLGEEARWRPRDWNRGLACLSALSETLDALDLLQAAARRSQRELAAELVVVWLTLWRDLRESGCLEPFGYPLLTLSGAREPDWREAARLLNGWAPEEV